MWYTWIMRKEPIGLPMLQVIFSILGKQKRNAVSACSRQQLGIDGSRRLAPSPQNGSLVAHGFVMSPSGHTLPSAETGSDFWWNCGSRHSHWNGIAITSRTRLSGRRIILDDYNRNLAGNHHVKERQDRHPSCNAFEIGKKVCWIVHLRIMTVGCWCFANVTKQNAKQPEEILDENVIWSRPAERGKLVPWKFR